MASCSEVHKSLQAVAQGLRWTYALLWQLCPDQGALVWAEGHYNGAIKTRKTVQQAHGAPAPPADQAARHRSRQLRELFESLAREAAAACGPGGIMMTSCRADAVQESASRRPTAALAPEDLTETEWFYLMCASYSFTPHVGLPGRAFAKGGHVWLCRANEVDSKVFSRAILAKSAGIQTVVCIPVVDGVLEIGTIENVKEDISLVQCAMSIFMNQQDIQMIPTISEHSTSDKICHMYQQSFQTQRKIHAGQEDEMEHDDDDIGAECASGSGTNAGRNYSQDTPLNIVGNTDDQATPNAGSSELMQLEMPERVRDGCSSNLDDEIQMLMVCQNSDVDQSDFQRQDEPSQSWHFLYEELCSGYPQSSGENQDIVLQPENAHYAETVMSILQSNTRRQAAGTSTRSYVAASQQSSFSTWHPTMLQQGRTATGAGGTTPQRMLRSVLFNNGAASGHGKPPEDIPRGGDGGPRREADFSANHVLQERKRREKLNERFIILRSLVPFVTKMDKASILGDTIEYVKQLRSRIQDLESSSTRQQQQVVHGCGGLTAAADQARSAKRKLATREGSSASSSSAPPSAEVQVSIIESDALLELRCPDRRGLLLRIMLALQDQLRLDLTAVRASSDDGVLLAELRAKVREVHGRRSSISEVKRAIHLIISSG